jgi:hypothetical protein
MCNVNSGPTGGIFEQTDNQRAESPLLPFHEALPAIIARMTIYEDVTLSKLITTTIIPANWDAIADAWDKRMKENYPASALVLIDDRVRQSLMAQKADVARLKHRVEPDHGEGLGL